MKIVSRAKRTASIAFLPFIIAAGVLTSPAMASAVTIEGAASGLPIAEGAGLTATSGYLVFTSSTGIMYACTEAELNGTVSSNGGATATVSVESSRLEGGGPLAGTCPTNIGAPLIINTNLDEGATWQLRFNDDGTFRLAGPFQFTLTFITGPETQVVCTFRGAEEEEGGGIGMISGTYTEAPGLTEITASGASYTIVAGPAELCGATGELNGTFQTESEGEGIVVS